MTPELSSLTVTYIFAYPFCGLWGRNPGTALLGPLAGVPTGCSQVSSGIVVSCQGFPQQWGGMCFQGHSGDWWQDSLWRLFLVACSVDLCRTAHSMAAGCIQSKH